MRGKLTTLARLGTRNRITPARAGKTLRLRYAPANSQDHPRACGENFYGGYPKGNPLGSPPRVRGKLIIRLLISLWSRITPARAGKTYHTTSSLYTLKDHPRACGENGSKMIENMNTEGSPPRVRGKRNYFYDSEWPGRITPARAGKTIDSKTGKHFTKDHPRACGENNLCYCLILFRKGSPPRVRGKRCAAAWSAAAAWITPARAGKTSGTLKGVSVG